MLCLHTASADDVTILLPLRVPSLELQVPQSLPEINTLLSSGMLWPLREPSPLVQEAVSPALCILGSVLVTILDCALPQFPHLHLCPTNTEWAPAAASAENGVQDLAVAQYNLPIESLKKPKAFQWQSLHITHGMVSEGNQHLPWVLTFYRAETVRKCEEDPGSPSKGPGG